MKKMNLLLLCNCPAKNAEAGTVTDHLDAFRLYSRHNIFVLSFLKRLPEKLRLDRFDAIVLHYSIPLGYLGLHYLDAVSRKRIKAYDGLKVVFIQDEYRSIEDVVNALSYMNIDLLFSCVAPSEMEKVYPSAKLPNLRKINNLTGYVPDRLLDQSVPAIKDRPIHVGYRTRLMPFWLGELGYEKWQIAVEFLKQAAGSKLALNISYDEKDRIYGRHWIKFISSCKSVLGVESGASVFDFDGSIKASVDNYTEQHPDADFFEVQEKFLNDHEGKIYLNQISPRCFEAAALKTAMVLYEGKYSGILHPDRHYIPLKKDFSNFPDVVQKLRDNRVLQEMVDRTYTEIAANPTYHYRTFIEKFDETLVGEVVARRKKPTKKQYHPNSYHFDLMRSPSYFFYRSIALPLQRIFIGTPIRKIIYRIWNAAPLKLRQSIRPLLAIIGR
jgi:hypothetical protein